MSFAREAECRFSPIPGSSDNPRRLTKPIACLSDPKTGRAGLRICIGACGAGTLIKEALSIDSSHTMISHTRVAPTGTSVNAN